MQETHIFMTIRPAISFATYNCKRQNATVFLSDGHKFKMKKSTPYLLWIENKTFLNSLLITLTGTKDLEK